MLEIETYRMMALLGLPHAQKATPILNVIESELATLATKVDTDMASRKDVTDAEDEQVLLSGITGLAARIEELRESRIERIPTVGEFMDRRLKPAMNTCEAIAQRQKTLAERISQTNDLLRTRVGIVQEQQNR